MRKTSLIDIERKNNSGFNNPIEFNKMDYMTQVDLLDWITCNLTKNKAFNHKVTSYGLKHRLAFYVTNGEFKGAMLKLGFRVWDKTDMNWRFNVYVKKPRRRV